MQSIYFTNVAFASSIALDEFALAACLVAALFVLPGALNSEPAIYFRFDNFSGGLVLLTMMSILPRSGPAVRMAMTNSRFAVPSGEKGI